MCKHVGGRHNYITYNLADAYIQRREEIADMLFHVETMLRVVVLFGKEPQSVSCQDWIHDNAILIALYMHIKTYYNNGPPVTSDT